MHATPLSITFTMVEIFKRTVKAENKHKKSLQELAIFLMDIWKKIQFNIDI